MREGARSFLIAAGVFAITLAALMSMGGGGPMETEFLQKVCIAIAPTALTLAASWIRTACEHMGDESAAREAERMALRALLRNELVRMHREWVEQKGYITLEALEYARQTYEAYHAIGGNGTGTKLFEDMEALQIKEERN